MPPPVRATGNDLPAPVADALASPHPGDRRTVEAAGIPWATTWWGALTDAPLLLLHGVTSSSTTWWRMAPALAAAGFRAVAVDLPGHGHTGHWLGHHRFRDTALDVVAFVRAAGLDRPDLAVIGHSWGALTAAAMPLAGLTPRVVVLLDPPALSGDWKQAMLDDPTERNYDDLAQAVTAIRGAFPGWTDGDVHAKAEALTQFDVGAAKAILLDNGEWDGGLRDLMAARDRLGPTWVVRGELATGGLMPDDVLPSFGEVIGSQRILTIAGAPHSPQRTHPEATLLALLRALRG